jgi:hypothetical protein
MICVCSKDFCMRNLQQKVEMGKKTGSELLPHSLEHLALRKCVMCARILGAHIQHITLLCPRFEKKGLEIGFLCSQERHKETS